MLLLVLAVGAVHLWNGRGSGAQALGAAGPQDLRLASFNVHYILLDKPALYGDHHDMIIVINIISIMDGWMD